MGWVSRATVSLQSSHTATILKSQSQSLKKSETTDQIRSISFRLINLCSRYADPFTWLQMLRDSKNKYDAKAKDESQTEEEEDKNSQKSS